MLRARLRVLLVDDFRSWQELAASILRTRPGLTIVGTASDGLEAVHRAEELQPDLIVLDIGLPKLNGLEASREIRQLCPKSKIIFLSQTTSRDVVQEAFREGAYGYVVKVDAGTELLLAVEAALQGKTFVSRRFSELDLLTACPHHKGDTHRHEVRFYSDDRLLLNHMAEFVGTALKLQRAGIVVATESHRKNFLFRLERLGLNVEGEIGSGRLVMLDAADALSAFMANGKPDQDQFLRLFGEAILRTQKAAKEPHAPIAIYGEGVDLLWKQGNAEAAIAVEKAANRLIRMYNIQILCGYSLNEREDKTSRNIIDRICAEHSAVHYSEGMGRPTQRSA